MDLALNPHFHMFFVLGLTCAAVLFFVRERVPLEVTSVGIVTMLLLFGQVFPFYTESGHNALDAEHILLGFANPSLIAVLALLVMGQGLIHTDALRFLTGGFAYLDERYSLFALYGVLIFVLVSSAFINNTPIVVIVIPLLQVLSRASGMSDSRTMIPLSYVAILGGMMTLVGSSTNLLVSSSLYDLGYERLSFFGFMVPGAMMAVAGLMYVIFVLPRLLPDRATMVEDLAGGDKEFVAEFDITEDSKLVGVECEEGRFPVLGEDISIRMIQRGGHLILPPFEGYVIKAGDILIGAATRDALMKVLSQYPGFLLSEEESRLISASHDENVTEERILAEIMITPASRFLDLSMEHASLDKSFGMVVLGIQRRAKVVRRRLGRIRLEPGDVLLVAGRRRAINALRDNTDFIVLSGSKRELPMVGKAPLAGAIFLGTIGAAAFGVLSIPVAAFLGAVAMVTTNCINIRQAMRAVDRKIFLLVGAMLALGTAMQATGGAEFISDAYLSLPFLDTPFLLLSGFFLLVAIATNLLSNNACAILFTPIAVNIAESLNVTPEGPFSMVFIFAVTVVFAANCSFASPIGYQTNLLVMGPGHYKFGDFIRAGIPLILILWGVYMLVLKFYFGL